MQLPDGVHAEISELCQEGDALAGMGQFTEAGQRYVEALRLLPGDPRAWAASTWIYVALGDVQTTPSTSRSCGPERTWTAPAAATRDVREPRSP